MTTFILGIDIAKDTFEVALQSHDRLRLASFSNDPTGYAKLDRWLKHHQAHKMHACLEATGRYGDALALHLYQAGHQVSVVNPLRIKRYAESKLQRNKTDREDAKVIADFCATQNPPLWKPPPPEKQELQALVRRQGLLIEDRTREINRQQSGISSETVQASIEVHLTFLNEQIEQLDAQIDALIDKHPSLRQQAELLTSIPGIGVRTAARLLGELPDLTGFDRAPQLAAYAGLTPRQHVSGSSVRKRSRLVKTGNRNLRTALYMPALTAINYNPIIRAQADRLRKLDKHNMVIVGAAMRKLLHLVYGILKSEQPFDPDFTTPQHSPAT